MAHPAPPKTRTWSFSFSVTRTEPDGTGETALSWVKRLSMLDLALIAAALTLFLVEPLAVSMYLTHRKLIPAAESCASLQGQQVVLQQDYAPAPHASLLPGPEDREQSLITPLNARDPSSLIMTPSGH
ncbi:MAG: hypothetical protein HYZ75_12565 [Elusimicrobia bacterium]|nr:hypothetical protein [Elusimicrobiota bacterium]